MNALMEILRDCQVHDAWHTHGSMIRPYGKFVFNNNVLESFWSAYNEALQVGELGITEKSQTYIPVLVDVDLKAQGNEEEYPEGLYTKETVEKLVEIYQMVLNELIECTPENLMCVFLSKRPYTIDKDDTRFMKHGFHLHFPNLFLRKIDQELYVIPRVKNEIKRIQLFKDFGNLDSDINRIIDKATCKNPWLMYGSKKQVGMESYSINTIYDCEMNELTLDQAFTDYILYDHLEQRIPMNDIPSLLPRILSIIPYGRSVSEIKETVPQIQVQQRVKSTEPINPDRVNQLLPHIKQQVINEHKSWFRLLYVLVGLGVDHETIHMISQRTTQGNYDEQALNRILQSISMQEIEVDIIDLERLCDKFVNETDYERVQQEEIYESEKLYIELDCADLYYAYIKDELIYTTSHKWIMYDEKCIWSIVEERSLVSKIARFCLDIIVKDLEKMNIKIQRLVCAGHQDKANNLAKQYKQLIKDKPRLTSSSNAKKILDHLMGYDYCFKPDTVMSEFDNNPSLLSFSDGNCIDITTCISRKLTKEDKVMITTGYAMPQRNEDDIRFAREFVQTMTGTGDKYESIMSMYATVLYGSNINELFFVITGSGGNGKNLLDNLMNMVLGDSYHQKLDVNQLINPSNDPSKANSNLFNARTSRMLVSSEPDSDSNAKLKVSIIKQLTGDGKISARDLHKSTISFIAKFVLFLYCNDIPALSSVDGGAKRRMKLITMPFKFVNKVVEPSDRLSDPRIKQKIASDMRYRNGMLYLLIDTWIKYQGIFQESQEITTTTNEYFENQNPLREWSLQYEHSTTKNKLTQKGTTLLYEYNNSLSPTEQDKKIAPSQAKRFYRYMDELGFREYTSDRIRYYYIQSKISTNQSVSEILDD